MREVLGEGEDVGELFAWVTAVGSSQFWCEFDAGAKASSAQDALGDLRTWVDPIGFVGQEGGVGGFSTTGELSCTKASLLPRCLEHLADLHGHMVSEQIP
jgi:hypothetical protein